MSGIILAWNRDGSPLDSGVFDAMLVAQGHRAIDGQNTWVSPDRSAMLGHQHFWTTPEEQGEIQPLVGGGIALAFDGRLDNRDELSGSLGFSRADASAHSDASLVLQAYQRWDDGVFERLLGPFAIVALDWDQGRVVFARDSIGRRTLCHHIDESRILIASEPSPLLAHPAIPETLDDAYFAHFYALRAPTGGETPFKAVKEVRPATAWRIDSDIVRSWRFWNPDPTARIRYDSDEEYAEHFGETLKRAVHRRLRAISTPTVMMSGGLDSTAVAGLAADLLKAEGKGPLRTVSWVFDELSELDEREFIEPMIHKHGLDATFVVADDAWPFRDLASWPYDPNGPEPNLYRNLLDRAYGVATADGTRVVLTGAAGDGIYTGAERWAASLIEDGRAGEAWREMREHASRLGWSRVIRSRSFRRVVSGELRRFGIQRSISPPPLPEWLSEYARTLLSTDGGGWNDGHPRAQQWIDLVGGEAGHLAISERFHAHRLRMDLRDPYLDRDLIELALQLPAHQLYSGGKLKAVLRSAMTDVLPESVLGRSRRSDFSPLFRLGARHERAAIEALTKRRGAQWKRFFGDTIVSTWVTGTLDAPRDEIALWYCASVQQWIERSMI